MERFAAAVVRWRIVVVAAVALLTLLAGYCIVRYARVEADISKYLPPEDPAVRSFNQAGERFGTVAVATVAVEADDIFTRAGLQMLDRLTRELALVPGVSWVISLTNVDDVKRIEDDGEVGVLVEKLISAEEIPESAQELERLRRYVLSKPRLVGTVVSADGQVANMMIHISAVADRVEVARRIEEITRRRAGDRRLYFSGFPFWMKTLTETILGDMVLLVPIVTLVIMLVLFLSFGSLRGVLLPLATVLISSTWAMGLMAALDIPITTLSNTVPVLLIALGTAYAIHLLHKYNEVAASAADAGAIRRALAEVMVPIGLAGLTTVVGFLSFLTSDLLFIQQTGLVAACGILAAMLVAVTFLPALLSWLPARAGVLRRQGEPTNRDRLLGWVGNHRRAVLLVALALALGAGALLPRLDRRFDMIAYFPPDSDVRRADAMMRDKLGGSVPLWIAVDGPVKHPWILRNMRLLEKYLAGLAAVHHPRSIAGFLAEINQVLNGQEAVPATGEAVGNLWLQIEGKDILQQLVTGDKQHALITAVCSTADTAVLRRLVRRVDTFIAGLPRHARPVAVATAGAELLQRAQRAEAARVASLLAFDLLAVGGQLPDDGWQQRQAARLAEQLGRPIALAVPVLEQALLRFLLSDESDLEIDDQRLAAALARELAGRLAGSTGPEPMRAWLGQLVPRELQRQDPEALDYLARSLTRLVQQLRRASWLDEQLQRLLGELTLRPRQLQQLRRRWRGDLAELTGPVLYLPVEQPGPGVVSWQLLQTGMHRISVNVDDGIVQSQLSSLGLAAVVAMLLLMLQLRSLLAGLLGMVPMLVTLLVNFGLMAAAGVDLEPATVLIASLVVGVGIDYTIHFLSRSRLELQRRGELGGAVAATLRTAGRAIIINAVTVACGQLVFLAGQLEPLRVFGVLLAVAMLVSAGAAVTLMPVLVLWLRPRFMAKRD